MIQGKTPLIILLLILILRDINAMISFSCESYYNDFKSQRSECIVNQGQLDSFDYQKEFKSNMKSLQNNNCIGAMQYSCNQQNKILLSSPDCKSDTLFVVQKTSQNVIEKMRFFFYFLFYYPGDNYQQNWMYLIDGQNNTYRYFYPNDYCSKFKQIQIEKDLNISSTQLNFQFKPFNYSDTSYQIYICPDFCDECKDIGCSKCTDGYFLSKDICSPCDSACQTCSGPLPSDCIICLNSQYISQKKGGICDSNCDLTQGQYIDQSNKNQKQCKMCINNCKTCRNSTTCETCMDKYYLSNQKQCSQCHNTCLSCSGPEKNKCIQCLSNNYYISEKLGGICDSNCDLTQGQYIDQSNQNQKQCKICINNCKTCSNSTTCETCMDKYYLSNQQQCSQCHNTCLSCSGPEKNKCIQCLSNNYYISEKLGGICDSNCDLTQGQYIDQSNQNQKQCKICINNCKTCSNSTTCETCMDKYYLSNQQQCSQCHNTCLSCSGPEKNKCIQCLSNNYYISEKLGGICDSNCDLTQGQYIDQSNQNQKQCKMCISYCKTCSDSTSCQTCMNNYVLIDGICLPCDNTCNGCLGPGKNQCIQCFNKNYFISEKKDYICDSNCDLTQGQFVDQSKPNQKYCKQCDLSCKACDGSTPNDCLACYPNFYLFNKTCVPVCPNGYSLNKNTLACESCQDKLNCNNCYKTCQLCTLAQIQSQQCNTCYSQTRMLDQNNQCVCLNQNDKRNLFYQCSYQNIAVIDATLSHELPQLLIDFGSPLKQIVGSSNQLCKQVFQNQTLALLGSDCECLISDSQLIVSLTDSSNIMESDVVNFKSGVLQFQDYNVFIDTFYHNQVYQNATQNPLLQFQNNFIENTCNPIIISLNQLKNDAGRGFYSLTWSLEELTGTTTNNQIQNIQQIMKIASQNLNRTLILNPSYIPPNQNITIKFSYLLKVNKTGQQIFKIFYRKDKIIRINYQQSIYPPIYRYKSLSFYFQFYIEACEFGNNKYFNEPVDLKIVSPQLSQIEQNIKNYNQPNFQLDIAPYLLPSNQTFNMSVILNLTSDNQISQIKQISIDVLISNLYLSIVGGSNFIVSYQKQFDLTSEFRDYEIQDPYSLVDVIFKWQCKSLSSEDRICYDYNHKKIQIQQGIHSISFPERNFQPYSIIVLQLEGQKGSRSANFSATCIFTELDIPPLTVQSPSQGQKINLNQELNFNIQYDSSIPSDILSYAGALLYKNKLVGAIKFDYYLVKFRIWNYFQDIDPSTPTIQVRFSVYNPSFVMPSLSTISLQINIPPKNCILSINPAQGIALQTVFSIQFLNCVDEDLPLTYQFFYYNSKSDYRQELLSPWNIARRLIKDQTTSYIIDTTLPQGNLVIMSQVMDSQLGISNSTLTVQVNGLNETEDNYYKFIDQIVQQSQQNSQSYNDQIVLLSIVGEELSKSIQFQASQKINDLKAKLITNLQQKSVQLPQFSLLSTYANKVIAQLQQTLTDVKENQKSSIYNQLQNIIKNTQSSIQNNNSSSLQQNNDINMQNLIDSFKILNSTVNQASSITDFEHYNNISFLIGNMLSNSSLPNQGQLILEGNLSSILSDTITQKNIYRYALPMNDSDSQNSTNQFNIVRNTYQQNIYENTTNFQAYVKQYQNNSTNFQYSKNKVITTIINSTGSQNLLNNSRISFQFNNAVSNKKYNMTCLQQNEIKWSKKGCSMFNSDDNNYLCFCRSQSPTTIIEDIDEMFLQNKNLDTVLGEQGIQNIAEFKQFYMYAAFWILTTFTAIEIFLFILGIYLDKKTTAKIKSQVCPEEQINKQSKDQEQQEQAHIQDLANLQLWSEEQQPKEQVFTPPLTNQNNPCQLMQNDSFQKSQQEKKNIFEQIGINKYAIQKTSQNEIKESQSCEEEQINKQSNDQECQEQPHVQIPPQIQLVSEDQEPRILASAQPQTNQNVEHQISQNDSFLKSPKEVQSIQSSQRTQKAFNVKGKRGKFQQLQNNQNQLQVTKQKSVINQNENHLHTTQKTSQNEIIENQDHPTQATDEKQQISFQNISFFKRIALFHQFLSIFYLFDDKISRSTRFTLFYIKIIHTLSISLLFSQYKEIIQLIIIALINSLVLGISTFFIQFTYKRGKFGKFTSIFFQIGLILTYFYITLAISSGKSVNDSNDFMMIFILSLLVDLMFTQVIISFLMSLLVRNHFKNNLQNSFLEKLFNLFQLKQIIDMIDV